MKKVVRLTEADLARIVKKVIRESQTPTDCIDCIKAAGKDIPGFTEAKANLILNMFTQGQIPTIDDLKSFINKSDIWTLSSFLVALSGCKSKCMPDL